MAKKNLEDMTLSELTELYNSKAETPVKKFPSKDKAIARIESLKTKKKAVKPSGDGTRRNTAEELEAKYDKFAKMVSRTSGATLDELTALSREFWGDERGWNDAKNRTDARYRLRILSEKRGLKIVEDDKGKFRAAS